MLIELTDDFVDRLYSLDNERDKDKALILIDNALSQVHLHHHIVFMSLKSIRELKCEDKIGHYCKRVLQWMENNIKDLYAIRQKVDLIVELTFCKTTCSSVISSKKSTYSININDLDEFKESILITENATDYDFYLGVFNWIDGNNFYSTQLKNIPSYGANADKTIISNDTDKEFICCIFDSDKSFNEDANGSTLKNAINGDKQRTNRCFPFYLYALPVKEKENLFPYSEYLYGPNIELNTKNLINLLVKETNEELLRFFDLKDGIKHKKLNNRNNNEKWRTLYLPFINKCKTNGVCASNCKCIICSKQTCKGCKNEDKKYIAGIGDKLLEGASKKFFNDPCLKFDNSTNPDSIFGNQKFILDIWKEIAHLLLNFGCSISRSINFNV